MKKRIPALLLILALLLTLAACNTGGTTPTESTTPDNSETPASGEAEVMTLRVGVEGEPNSKYFGDPGGGIGSAFYAYSCFTNLWVYTTDGEFHYLLGESYEFNAEGTELTIKIRDEAKFANGDKITADDVLFSAETESTVRGDRTVNIDLEKSYVVDDTTVVFVLKKNTPTMIEDLALIYIGCRSWTENRENEDHMYINVLESGPYWMPGGWTTGTTMVLEKNPYYWDKDSLAYDRIEVYFIAEENTRYLEFTTGGLDLCYLSDSKNIDSVKADGKFSLYQAPYQCNVGLVLNTNTTDLFQNEDLRLAIMYAVDTKTIVETICGSAYIHATSMLPSSNWAYKNVEYTYNPELAKEYYEKSGVKDFSWTLTVNNSEPNPDIAEAIQAYLAEIGIDMKIDVVDMPTFFSQMATLDSTITQYSGSSDPGGVLNSWLSTANGALNKTPSGIQELLDEACFSLEDKATRTAMFHDLQDKVAATGKFLPIFEKTVNFGQAAGVDSSKSVQADGYLISAFLK